MPKKIKIDKKDYALFQLLKENSRIPNTVLAKKIGVSRLTISKKIDFLREIGMIKKFLPIVDFAKFNVETPLLFLSFKNVNEKQERDIILYLTSQSEVGWCVKTLGKWNVAFAAFVRHPSNILFLLDNILKKFPNKIADYNIGIVSSVIDNRAGSPEAIDVIKSKEGNFKLSQKEQAVLKLLDQDGRMSFTEMTVKSGISYKTLKSVLEKLKRNNVIKKFTCQVDYSPIGQRLHTLLIRFRKRDEENTKRFVSHIFSYFNAYYGVRLIGHYDFAIEFWIGEDLEIEKIISDLKLRFSDLIEAIEHLVYMHEYKLTYLPPKVFL